MDDTPTELTVQVTSTQMLVHGPVCRFPTRRIHRRDVRTVADLPWGPWRVVLRLQVRKVFCANGRCTRRIFAERLAPLVAPWARRTQRLTQWLVHIAVALAGAGSRWSPPPAPDPVRASLRNIVAGIVEAAPLIDVLEVVRHRVRQVARACGRNVGQVPVERL